MYDLNLYLQTWIILMSFTGIFLAAMDYHHIMCITNFELVKWYQRWYKRLRWLTVGLMQVTAIYGMAFEILYYKGFYMIWGIFVVYIFHKVFLNLFRNKSLVYLGHNSSIEKLYTYVNSITGIPRSLLFAIGSILLLVILIVCTWVIGPF